MNLPKIPPWLETVLRVIQFGAALASLIIWAVYLDGLASGSTSPMKAVLGIIVAGTIWTLSSVLQWAWKHRQAKKGKAAWGAAAVGVILFIALMDFLFIILFATVAGLTGPSGNGSGGCQVAQEDGGDNDDQDSVGGCGQGKAVFGLALVNVFSFSGSSIMNMIQSTQRPPNPKSFYSSGKHIGGVVSDQVTNA